MLLLNQRAREETKVRTGPTEYAMLRVLQEEVNHKIRLLFGNIVSKRRQEQLVKIFYLTTPRLRDFPKGIIKTASEECPEYKVIHPQA